MFRSECLVCGSKRLHTIIDLGMHPFADTFISKERLSEADHFYWLACELCADCGQIQAKCVTDPVERYSRHDYSYTSSNSAFSRNHWENFARGVSQELHLGEEDFIVEIGSNDGFLLEQFRKRGCRVLGVDASPFMSNLAKERGLDTVVGLFDGSLSRTIRDKHGAAQSVIANNVFNHANDVLGFAGAARDLLEPGGTFVFELPYWAIGLQQGKFDQIYHEHVSYFTVRSSCKIMQMTRMEITKVETVDYHGGSLRVFARKNGAAPVAPEACRRMIEEETTAGVFSPETYKAFMTRTIERRHRFLHELYGLKGAGLPVVGVGAAAKGNTLLNFFRLDAGLVDCITDSSPFKQGKYTPGTRIPIRDDTVFRTYQDVVALILSWNISEVLKQKLLELNPRIRFVVP